MQIRLSSVEELERDFLKKQNSKSSNKAKCSSPSSELSLGFVYSLFPRPVAANNHRWHSSKSHRQLQILHTVVRYLAARVMNYAL